MPPSMNTDTINTTDTGIIKKRVHWYDGYVDETVSDNNEDDPDEDDPDEDGAESIQTLVSMLRLFPGNNSLLTYDWLSMDCSNNMDCSSTGCSGMTAYRQYHSLDLRQTWIANDVSQTNAFQGRVASVHDASFTSSASPEPSSSSSDIRTQFNVNSKPFYASTRDPTKAAYRFISIQRK